MSALRISDRNGSSGLIWDHLPFLRPCPQGALEWLPRRYGKDGFLAGRSIGCRVMITLMPRKYESGLSFAVEGFRACTSCSPPPDRKSTRLNSSHLGISY